MLSTSSSDGFRDVLREYRQATYADARALPGAFYTDPGMLDLERSTLFAREWVCVGREDEIPTIGDYMTFDLVGEPLVIVRGADNAIRALSNVCRHRAMAVAHASGRARSFVCPYHHWTYDTTGKLVNAPGMEEKPGFDPDTCRLPQFRTEIWHGFLFVTLDESTPPLAASLTDLSEIIGRYHVEDMAVRYSAVETWETNWKSLVENFMEGYHLTPLHRRTLAEFNPTRLCRHFRPGEQYFGYTVGFDSRITQERVGHPQLSENERNTCVMFCVPPGLTVGVGSDYSSFLCIVPVSCDSVRLKSGLMFFGEDWTPAQIDQATALFQQTMAEDKAVLVELPRGLRSRHHRPGSLAPQDLEGPIWDFYQYLGRRLLPALER